MARVLIIVIKIGPIEIIKIKTQIEATLLEAIIQMET